LNKKSDKPSQKIKPQNRKTRKKIKSPISECKTSPHVTEIKINSQVPFRASLQFHTRLGSQINKQNAKVESKTNYDKTDRKRDNKTKQK